MQINTHLQGPPSGTEATRKYVDRAMCQATQTLQAAVFELPVFHGVGPQFSTKKHAIIRDVLDYRNARKLKSTYVDQLPTAVNAETGRLHTHYSQTWTATVDLTTTGHSFAVLVGYEQPLDLPLSNGSVLLVDILSSGELFGFAPQLGPVATFTTPEKR